MSHSSPLGPQISFAVAMLLLVSAPTPADANLLGNGDLETKPAGSGLILATEMPPRVIDSWALPTGSIDWTGSGLLKAADGNFSIDLEGRMADGAGVLEQSFATIPSENYRVGFALAGNNAGGAVVKNIEASVDSVVESFFFDTTGTTSQNMGWVCESVDFTATGASATLSFTSLLNSGFGPQLDIVSVETDPELVNGDFETPPAGSGLIKASEDPPRVLLGWELVAGSIDWTGAGVLQPAAGNYSIDLEGRAPDGAGVLQQTFPTVAGEAYRVDFFLAGNPSGGAVVKRLRVHVPWATSDYTFDTTGKTTVAMGWVPEVFYFVADSSETTLSFRSLDNSGFGPTIDEVSVTVVTDCERVLELPAIPQVPSLSGTGLKALAAGLLLVGAAAVRSRFRSRA